LIQKLVVGAMVGLAAGLSVAVQAASAADSTRESCSRQEEAANKKIVMKALTSPQDYANLSHPDYIQHEPAASRFSQINHLHGKQSMDKLIEVMGKLGASGPPPTFLAKRTLMVAECDLVMALRQVEEPDPQNPGKTYTAFGFEMFRIKDGKLYEHWDDDRISNPPQAYLTAPIKDLKLAH